MLSVDSGLRTKRDGVRTYYFPFSDKIIKKISEKEEESFGQEKNGNSLFG